MKLCLRCNQYFDDTHGICPQDQTPLESVGKDQLIGALISDRYVIDSVIGKGSSGIVYKATRIQRGDKVAIKVCYNYLGAGGNALDRFLREARAASKLRNPHIINIWDSGITDDGQPFFVMDYLEGITLGRLITENGCLSPGRTLAIIKQVTNALSEAHKQGIIHRDLKPENVILQVTDSGEDFVKLLDFGIADLQTDLPRIDKPKTVAGSPAYMSPEQCQGFQLDARSDIYSLAIVVFEMLTGRRPFRGEEHVSLMFLHVSEKPMKLSEVRPELSFSAEVEAAIAKALSKHPAQRQSTVEEFFRDLELAILGSSQTAAGGLEAPGKFSFDTLDRLVEPELSPGAAHKTPTADLEPVTVAPPGVNSGTGNNTDFRPRTDNQESGQKVPPTVTPKSSLRNAFKEQISEPEEQKRKKPGGVGLSSPFKAMAMATQTLVGFAVPGLRPGRKENQPEKAPPKNEQPEPEYSSLASDHVEVNQAAVPIEKPIQEVPVAPKKKFTTSSSLPAMGLNNLLSALESRSPATPPTFEPSSGQKSLGDLFKKSWPEPDHHEKGPSTNGGDVTVPEVGFDSISKTTSQSENQVIAPSVPPEQPEARSMWETSDSGAAASKLLDASEHTEAKPKWEASDSETIWPEAASPSTEIPVDQMQLPPPPAQAPADDLQTPSQPSKKKLFTTTKHDMLAPKRAELRRVTSSQATPLDPALLKDEKPIKRQEDDADPTLELPPIITTEPISEATPTEPVQSPHPLSEPPKQAEIIEQKATELSTLGTEAIAEQQDLKPVSESIGDLPERPTSLLQAPQNKLITTGGQQRKSFSALAKTIRQSQGNPAPNSTGAKTDANPAVSPEVQKRTQEMVVNSLNSLASQYQQKDPSAGDTSPVRQSGSFPVKQSGSFPVKQSGSFPVKQSGSFPVKQSGSFPVKQSGSFPRQSGSLVRQSGSFVAPTGQRFIAAAQFSPTAAQNNVADMVDELIPSTEALQPVDVNAQTVVFDDHPAALQNLGAAAWSHFATTPSEVASEEGQLQEIAVQPTEESTASSALSDQTALAFSTEYTQKAFEPPQIAVSSAPVVESTQTAAPSHPAGDAISEPAASPFTKMQRATRTTQLMPSDIQALKDSGKGPVIEPDRPKDIRPNESISDMLLSLSFDHDPAALEQPPSLLESDASGSVAAENFTSPQPAPPQALQQSIPSGKDEQGFTLEEELDKQKVNLKELPAFEPVKLPEIPKAQPLPESIRLTENVKAPPPPEPVKMSEILKAQKVPEPVKRPESPKAQAAPQPIKQPASQQAQTTPEPIRLPESLKAQAVPEPLKLPESPKVQATPEPLKLPESLKPQAAPEPLKLPESPKAQLEPELLKLPESPMAQLEPELLKLPESPMAEATADLLKLPESPKVQPEPEPFEAEEGPKQHLTTDFVKELLGFDPAKPSDEFKRPTPEAPKATPRELFALDAPTPFAAEPAPPTPQPVRSLGTPKDLTAFQLNKPDAPAEENWTFEPIGPSAAPESSAARTPEIPTPRPSFDVSTSDENQREPTSLEAVQPPASQAKQESTRVSKQNQFGLSGAKKKVADGLSTVNRLIEAAKRGPAASRPPNVPSSVARKGAQPAPDPGPSKPKPAVAQDANLQSQEPYRSDPASQSISRGGPQTVPVRQMMEGGQNIKQAITGDYNNFSQPGASEGENSGRFLDVPGNMPNLDISKINLGQFTKPSQANQGKDVGGISLILPPPAEFMQMNPPARSGSAQHAYTDSDYEQLDGQAASEFVKQKYEASLARIKGRSTTGWSEAINDTRGRTASLRTHQRGMNIGNTFLLAAITICFTYVCIRFVVYQTAGNKTYAPAPVRSIKVLLEKKDFEQVRKILEKKLQTAALSKQDADDLDTAYVNITKEGIKAKDYDVAMTAAQKIGPKSSRFSEAKKLLRQIKRLRRAQGRRSAG